MKSSSGWLCPRCDTVNAPFVRQCPCSRGGSLAERVGMPKPGLRSKPSPGAAEETWISEPRRQPPKAPVIIQGPPQPVRISSLPDPPGFVRIICAAPMQFGR